MWQGELVEWADESLKGEKLIRGVVYTYAEERVVGRRERRRPLIETARTFKLRKFTNKFVC